MTSTFLVDEVQKTINNKNLIDTFKQYLNKENVSCDQVKFVINKDSELKKYEDLLIESHKIFVYSQEMLDELACKDITPYKNRDVDIVMCYTFYSGVCVILEKYLPADLYEKILDIYEEANIKMNVPRDDEEENKIFFNILRMYFSNFFIPVKMSHTEVSINEYDFGMMYYEKILKSEEIPEFILKKMSGNKVQNDVESEILNMCFI
ncbi:uncharacterized protein VNE69_12119 [Vairimorpha necatrix]|uniref:Uncharacterized protein n=1 Tax=Vairimorpha necatrix TaxID=6039 RepID=A0AAX4JGP1_9MICR